MNAKLVMLGTLAGSLTLFAREAISNTASCCFGCLGCPRLSVPSALD